MTESQTQPALFSTRPKCRPPRRRPTALRVWVYGTVVIAAMDGQVTVEVKEPGGVVCKVISTLAAAAGRPDGTDPIERGHARVTRRAFVACGYVVSDHGCPPRR